MAHAESNSRDWRNRKYWHRSLAVLERHGVALRAMVRQEADITRLGSTSASVVVADFNDAGAVAAALRGVTRAYLVTPSSADAETQQIRFAELAAAAGVRQLVKLSQFAADVSSPVWFLRYHAAVEQRIRELGIGYTFLRPNLYFQRLLVFRSSIAGDGRFFAPIGQARVSAVDVRDIAAVAAVVMTAAWAYWPNLHHHRTGCDHSFRDCSSDREGARAGY